MTAKKQVAPKQSTEIGDAIDYGEYGADGFENQTSDDISIPFLAVLQALSPQLDTLEGAKAGMLINTVSEELIDGKVGVEFVPAVTQHVYVEWVPRDQGGGFVCLLQPDDPEVKKAIAASEEYGKYKVGNNDLVETFYVYGALVDEDGEPSGMAVVAFTSTKIKVYKHWNTKIRMFTVKGANGRKVRPPLFAHRVRLKTVSDENKKGKFHNFALEPAEGNLLDSLLKPGDPRLEAAVSLKEMIESGTAKAAFDSQSETGGEGGDVPF